MIKKKIVLPLILVFLLTLTACTTDNVNLAPDTDTPSVVNQTPGEDANSPEDDTTNDDITGEYNDIKISPLEAFDKYMDKYPDTKVKKMELDEDYGEYVYEVKGYDDESEYELKIDPVNGDILKEEKDSRDDDEEEAISRGNVEKVADIVDKALKEAGAEYRLEEWTLKVKNGRAQIEVEMDREDGDDFEYTYDVETGEIIDRDD